MALLALWQPSFFCVLCCSSSFIPICCGIRSRSRNNWLHDVNRAYYVRELSVEDSITGTWWLISSPRPWNDVNYFCLLLFFGVFLSLGLIFISFLSLFLLSFCLITLYSHPSLQITVRRQWKHVYDELGGNPSSTSAATCTRRHYERWVIMSGSYIWHIVMHAHVNSLHRLKWVNSFTATSNVLSQCFICNIRTQQNTYWSYLRKVNVHMKSNSGMPTVLACSCNCI